MQLIEAALAFAITMLALSMICSSIVELIHRGWKMREDGLEYMLGQLFDQVLAKYVPDTTRAELRENFLRQMTANRAPMGLDPDPTLQHEPPSDAKSPGLALGNLWGGRRVTSLTTADFMERLGALEVGKEIDTAAATARDVVLKDIAQKFEGFGKDAATYFEGRARFMSVMVAIVVAFLAHVDAIDLFKTYLRDPNARAEVIKQSETITAQFDATRKVIDVLEQEAKRASTAAGNPLNPPNGNAAGNNDQGGAANAGQPADGPIKEDIKKQIDTLRKDALDTIAKANATVKQFADLGVPLGWNVARIEAAGMWQWVWYCKDKDWWETRWQERCRPPSDTAGAIPSQAQTKDVKGKAGADGEKAGKAGEQVTADEQQKKDAAEQKRKKEEDRKEREYRVILLQFPTVISVYVYLIFGGLLVGLGAPFWYNAVTGLTNLRDTVRGLREPAPGQQSAAVAASGTPQPVTPVDVFSVSREAEKSKKVT